jgi:hypothetical protein
MMTNQAEISVQPEYQKNRDKDGMPVVPKDVGFLKAFLQEDEAQLLVFGLERTETEAAGPDNASGGEGEKQSGGKTAGESKKSR